LRAFSGTIVMVIAVSPELEAALSEVARLRGVAPEALALQALQDQFLADPRALVPQDDWERHLLEAASDCGVSLPHSALRGEGLYE
jgi:predicted transcriptional regulator